jgi:hypothetical protein
MGKRNKKNDDGDKKKKTIVRSGRPDKVIIGQFTRRLRRIIKSSGIGEAKLWVHKMGPTTAIGRGKNKGRTIVLPVKQFKDIIASA